VKGLTYTAGGEDYEYYMHSLKELDIDICGMSETNTPWQHHYLTQEFTTRARRHRDMVEIEFGSPDPTVDSVPATETFQAGGSLTIAMDTAVTILTPGAIKDNTGLGRWSGLTLRGKKNQYLTIITAYRTCGGTINTANIGGIVQQRIRTFPHARISTTQSTTTILRRSGKGNIGQIGRRPRYHTHDGCQRNHGERLEIFKGFSTTVHYAICIIKTQLRQHISDHPHDVLTLYLGPSESKRH
jgi:hypothetical protein